ncbi:MAG TPA: rhodanese-like domain-containing protein [Elusimicrobiota bacterium]|jgi:rhodanese-related sulfurtransferase|nr:rhodanese-like domain-containing protein [Elusimicrobiota bacterium]
MAISGKRLGVSVEPEDPNASYLITPKELSALLKEAKPPVVIDVRSEREFKMLRLDGAKLATRELVEEIFTKWDKETAIVVYDHKGRMGLDAAKALASRGFSKAKGLKGGIDAWSQEIDPLIPRY